jgi:PAS domain S-box-containing protein
METTTHSPNLINLLSSFDSDQQQLAYQILYAISEAQSAHKEADRIFNASLDILGTLDLEGNFIKLNPAFSEIVGYPVSESINLNCTQFLHPSDIEFFIDKLQTVKKTETSSFELRFLSKSKDYIWLAWTATFENDSNLIHFVARDITQRKRQDKQLEDLRFALDESAIVAITEVTGKITFVNDRFCAISKYSREELIGQDHRIVNSGHHSAEFIRSLWVTIANGKTWRGEIKNKAKDGSYYWVDTTIVPFLDEQAKPYQYVAIRYEITERKNVQEEREKLIGDLHVANRLATENARLKSEFLATMSHELRTPMNAIEGFTSIMLKHMGGAEYNEKTARYLEKVHSNSQRLLNLINDFLDLSRIESGRMELSYLPIKPMDLALRWQTSMSSLAERKHLAFLVEVDETLPELVYGDEEALSKIVINLLGNAFKFTSQGHVKLRLTNVDNRLQIEVEDTGIGIPPHAREFIFDEFRQVDQSSKRQYGGTGLGLAIVHKLVREMGGTIALQSTVGEGSTFTVSVPFQRETAFS